MTTRKASSSTPEPEAPAAFTPPTDPVELRLCWLPHLDRYTDAPQPYSTILNIPGAVDHGPVPESFGQDAGVVPPPLDVPASWLDDDSTEAPLAVPASWADPETVTGKPAADAPELDPSKE